jgi:hypothetical protein
MRRHVIPLLPSPAVTIVTHVESKPIVARPAFLFALDRTGRAGHVFLRPDCGGNHDLGRWLGNPVACAPGADRQADRAGHRGCRLAAGHGTHLRVALAVALRRLHRRFLGLQPRCLAQTGQDRLATSIASRGRLGRGRPIVAGRGGTDRLLLHIAPGSAGACRAGLHALHRRPAIDVRHESVT